MTTLAALKRSSVQATFAPSACFTVTASRAFGTTCGRVMGCSPTVSPQSLPRVVTPSTSSAPCTNSPPTMISEDGQTRRTSHGFRPSTPSTLSCGQLQPPLPALLLIKQHSRLQFLNGPKRDLRSLACAPSKAISRSRELVPLNQHLHQLNSSQRAFSSTPARVRQ